MKLWWGAIAALALAGTASASPVLLISLDGLRPGDVTAERTPHLAALAREGASAEGVTGVLPTLTYPSHTTLMTGVAPAVHGISNNLTFDPFNRNQTGWYWYASDIKVPTLWDASHKAGLKTANVHWPVSVGTPSIDLNLPQIWRTGEEDDRKLMASLATPGLLSPLEQQLGRYEQGMDETVEGDAVRAKFAASILQRDKPDFMTVYLAGIDHEEHHSGPGSDAANTTIEKTDAIVGDLVRAARAAMPSITIVVVSDHGFLPVSTDVNLYAPFLEAKLITLGSDGKVTSWEAEPWFAGGSAAIVLARPQDKILVDRVRTLLGRLKENPAFHINKILEAPEIAGRGGPAEASFMLAFEPGFEMGRDPTAPITKASTYKGMHGYLPDLPEMRSTLIVAGPHLRKQGNLGVVDMRAIAPSIAGILNVRLDSALMRPVF